MNMMSTGFSHMDGAMHKNGDLSIIYIFFLLGNAALYVILYAHIRFPAVCWLHVLYIPRINRWENIYPEKYIRFKEIYLLYYKIYLSSRLLVCRLYI